MLKSNCHLAEISLVLILPMAIEEFNFIVSSNADLNKRVQIDIQLRNLSQRSLQALKKFILLFLAAILFVPIPGLHFVLVPVLLISSLVVPYMEFKTIYVNKSVESLPCLVCQTPIRLKKSLNFPFRTRCEKCGEMHVLKNLTQIEV